MYLTRSGIWHPTQLSVRTLRGKGNCAKMAREARRELEAGRAVLPTKKVINRPAVTKLWVNGRASEDRDERERATRTQRASLKYKPKRSDARGSVVIGVLPSRGVGLRSHEVRCWRTRPTGLPTAW